jgi:hypothetical protein
MSRPSIAIAAGAVTWALSAGFIAPLVSDTVGHIFWLSILAVSLVAVIVAGLLSRRVLEAVVIGALTGFFAAVLWNEGRWLAYLTGWNSLEIDRFLSALGEMPVTAGEAQMLALILGTLLGLPMAAVGAIIGWMASRRQDHSSGIPTTD